MFFSISQIYFRSLHVASFFHSPHREETRFSFLALAFSPKRVFFCLGTTNFTEYCQMNKIDEFFPCTGPAIDPLSVAEERNGPCSKSRTRLLLHPNVLMFCVTCCSGELWISTSLIWLRVFQVVNVTF